MRSTWKYQRCCWIAQPRAGKGPVAFDRGGGKIQRAPPAAELYRVEIDAPTVAAKMNGALVSGGEVSDFMIVP